MLELYALQLFTRELEPRSFLRLTLALKYESLDARGREAIWEQLLARVAPDAAAGDFDCAALARTPTNGRQIKNCVRLAMALKLDQGVELTQAMLEETLGIVNAFQSDLTADDLPPPP